MKEYTINNETIKIEDLIDIEKNVFLEKRMVSVRFPIHSVSTPCPWILKTAAS